MGSSVIIYLVFLFVLTSSVSPGLLIQTQNVRPDRSLNLALGFLPQIATSHGNRIATGLTGLSGQPLANFIPNWNNNLQLTPLRPPSLGNLIDTVNSGFGNGMIQLQLPFGSIGRPAHQVADNWLSLNPFLHKIIRPSYNGPHSPQNPQMIQVMQSDWKNPTSASQQMSGFDENARDITTSADNLDLGDVTKKPVQLDKENEYTNNDEEEQFELDIRRA